MHGCSGVGACMVAPGVYVVARGACMVALGGMRGCSGGTCMVAPGGACVIAPRGACVVLPGGMRGFFWGVCMVFYGGVCMVFSGDMHGFFWGGVHRIRRDTVNERAVRILLECILVHFAFVL